MVKDLAVVRPEQVWCADFTYIALCQKLVYLAAIVAFFTRSLRGWHLARTLSSDLAVTALDRALALHQPEIHHSDQGVQDAAHGYVTRLQAVHAQMRIAEIVQSAHSSALVAVGVAYVCSSSC